MVRVLGWMALLWLVGWRSAVALEITIAKGNEAALPIAVVPFPGSGIVANDLKLSGEFAPLSPGEMLSRPRHFDEINFTDWRLLRVPTMLVGRELRDASGVRRLEVQLINVNKQEVMVTFRLPIGSGTVKRLRKIAHTISDMVYQELTGVRGVFRTHVAYVSVAQRDGGDLYTLEVADFDGQGAQVLLSSSSPLLSPSWSPDGRRLAYVSFENRRSEVWLQEVYTGKRTLLASFKGSNSAPAWSPDGRWLAISLSREGNAEIYRMDLQQRSIQRLTSHRAIDTEPAWSPDGSQLVFLSDRSGTPQLYRMAVGGGHPERITFKGRYNTSPDWAADGRQLTFLKGDGGRYRIAVLDLESGVERLLSDNQQDESPSFAPNGRLIVYATQAGERGVLEVAATDGSSVQRFSLIGKDVREPAWSPFATEN